MKPRPFTYVRPRDLEHALELLDEHAGSAVLLAGGQSLMPLLNMRLASAEVLLDINALSEMSGIEDCGSFVRVGATTRYYELERSPVIAAKLPLLPHALKHVAHTAIRNRGTLGGSLALADPAAEMPACALALDATVVVQSVRGTRCLPVDAFVQGIWETALEPDEAIVCVHFPLRSAGESFAFLEFARRHGDFAEAGVILTRAPVPGARAVVFGVGPRAFRVPVVEEWLDRDLRVAEVPVDVKALFREAVETAAEESVNKATRTTMAVTLFERAVPLLVPVHQGRW